MTIWHVVVVYLLRLFGSLVMRPTIHRPSIKDYRLRGQPFLNNRINVVINDNQIGFIYNGGVRFNSKNKFKIKGKIIISYRYWFYNKQISNGAGVFDDDKNCVYNGRKDLLYRSINQKIFLSK